MLGEVCRALLIPSFAGAVLAAVLLLLRPVTRRLFSSTWHYYIWLGVLLVMVLPVRFAVPQGAAIPPAVMHANPAAYVLPAAAPAQTAADDTYATPTAQMQRADTRNSAIAAIRQFARSVADALGVVWLIGALGMLVFHLVGYAVFMAKIRTRSVPVACPELAYFTRRNIRVRAGQSVCSPLMTGVFRPTLLLPAAPMSPEQLHNVLLHEMTHFRRKDILYKWAVVLVKCIHWFNPMVYCIARQINLECEISCDLSVVRHMTREERRSYVDTILHLLSVGKPRALPLTTGMACSKKVMKRRFTMIKNTKATNKLVSVLSAVIAAILLSTTVFASGMLTDMAADSYSIEVTNNGQPVVYENEPFIEDGALYLPLRETLNAFGYNNIMCGYDTAGTLTRIMVIFENAGSDTYAYGLITGSPKIEVNIGLNPVLDDAFAIGMTQLRNGTTYVPYGLFYRMQVNHNTFFNQLGLDVTAYDKNGAIMEDITPSANAEFIQWNPPPFDENDPQYTVSLFFNAFARRDFDVMKTYCTPNCISGYFGDGYVFGMTEAALLRLEADPLEYAKSSNDFQVLVNVAMQPASGSIYDPDQTQATFYVCLLRQPDGRYLIDSFATGL